MIYCLLSMKGYFRKISACGMKIPADVDGDGHRVKSGKMGRVTKKSKILIPLHIDYACMAYMAGMHVDTRFHSFTWKLDELVGCVPRST